MAKELTARQREVLDAIRNYAWERGYPPSIRELGKLLGIRSLRGVTIHLDALQKKGWIERESTSRSIRILLPVPSAAGSAQAVSVPLLGTIAAGRPLLAVENVESYISIPTEIESQGDELFALQVQGDSMIGDHILDGDTIIVKNQGHAENGDVVAALIDDEATVKRLDSKSSPAMLVPSNPNYDPINVVKEEVRILGTVVGLIRTWDGN